MIFSRVLRDSTPRFLGSLVHLLVRRSVGLSVRRSVLLYFFKVFAIFGLTVPPQVIK